MRILLIDNDVFVDKGAELCIYKNTGEFALELKGLGNSVELFQTKHAVQSNFHDFNVLNRGFRITALKRYQHKLFTYLNAYIFGIWRLMHNDFLYLYYPTNYEYLAFFAKLFGKQYGLNVRGERDLQSQKSLLLYKYAKVVSTVSPYFTAVAESAGARGVTQKPAISFDEHDIVDDKQYELKAHYKLLYLARLDKAKGIYELIYSIAELVRMNYNVSLVIVGDGIEDKQLRSLVKELDLGNNIFFEGAITEKQRIAEYYKSADLFVLPSYHEGFPRTLYEAMIFGIPIVTTFVGGIPYLMKNDFNCVEIQPKSVDSLTEKISNLLDNYNSAGVMVKNAIDTVRDIVASDRPTHAMVLNAILQEE
jgi:glycosyltransferase involved in cell wall biosynthesis